MGKRRIDMMTEILYARARDMFGISEEQINKWKEYWGSLTYDEKCEFGEFHTIAPKSKFKIDKYEVLGLLGWFVTDTFASGEHHDVDIAVIIKGSYGFDFEFFQSIVYPYLLSGCERYLKDSAIGTLYNEYLIEDNIKTVDELIEEEEDYVLSVAADIAEVEGYDDVEDIPKFILNAVLRQWKSEEDANIEDSFRYCCIKDSVGVYKKKFEINRITISYMYW